MPAGMSGWLLLSASLSWRLPNANCGVWSLLFHNCITLGKESNLEERQVLCFRKHLLLSRLHRGRSKEQSRTLCVPTTYAALRIQKGSPKRPGPLYEGGFFSVHVHLQSNPTASGPRGPSQSKTDTWLAQAFKQEAGAFQGKATSSKSQNSSAGEVAFTSCSASFRPMPMGQLASEKEKHGHVF